ncbi:hypothetical protein T12_4871 [Trichinella patagoniensis]|uniref:Uncharacterized protein n=1 Tax=Trichinella patagoniensis TaxID=990121 RepID=A0A0V0ZQH1_9BILA|nr:hypothetical protein T12_4871 [Trichinella patagoniensis]
MLKRETIIDRRPTTTTRSVNVNWFQNRHTIAEQHRQVYRIIVDDRSGRKGGHRTNTTTSNDNDYWPSPTTAASCEGNLLRKRRPGWSACRLGRRHPLCTKPCTARNTQKRIQAKYRAETKYWSRK